MSIRQYRDLLTGKLQNNLSKLSEKLQTLNTTALKNQKDMEEQNEN